MLHILLCYYGFTFYTLLSVIITQHFLQCIETAQTILSNYLNLSINYIFLCNLYFNELYCMFMVSTSIPRPETVCVSSPVN